MATKIQMNLLNSSGSYEVLYPQTDYSNVLNTPTIPDTSNFVTSPVYINEGGTQATTASGAIYNLVSGCSGYTYWKNYITTSYFPYYCNSTGYKLQLSNLVLIDKQSYSISTSETSINITSISGAPSFVVFVWSSTYGAIKINDKSFGDVADTSIQKTVFTLITGYNIRSMQDPEIWLNASSLKVKTSGGSCTLSVYLYYPW